TCSRPPSIGRRTPRSAANWRRRAGPSTGRPRRRCGWPPPPPSKPRNDFIRSVRPGDSPVTPSRRTLAVGLPVVFAGAVGLALALGGCSPTAPPPTAPAAVPGTYTDVTAASGVDVVYQNGEAAGR